MQKKLSRKDCAPMKRGNVQFINENTASETIIGRRNNRQMTLLYRPYDKRDGKECSRILTEAFIDSVFWGGEFLTDGDLENAGRYYSCILMDGSASRFNYRVVLFGDDVIGVCGFVRQADRAKLIDVSVAMILQGNGIGDFMIRAVLDEIKSLDGIRKIFLYSSPVALGLYQRHGFVVPVCPDEKPLDINGNTYMEKTLNPGHN